MREEPDLGAVARRLRLSRGLTLAAVGRRAGCSPSLLSQVETGARHLQPWLARALDAAYQSGEALSTLVTRGHGDDVRQGLPPQEPGLVLVQLPRQGFTVAVSRRDLLAALGIGAVHGTLLATLDRVSPPLRADAELLAELKGTVGALQATGRALAPGRLIAPLMGQVAVIDAVRRRARAPWARDFMILQAGCAESLSWMAEESGDVTGALYWVDRVQQWASMAGWQTMTAYAHVRRSMLAISHASDGLAAAEQAAIAFCAPGSPRRIRGLAAKQMAFGFALAGRPDASKRALDQATSLLDAGTHGEDEDRPSVGQLSVDIADLLVIYQATCDVYLGGGERIITALRPLIDALGTASRRTQAITQAKLAQAYARAGEPAAACELAWRTADAAIALGSRSCQGELRRVLPALARWPGREDVAELRNRLAALG